ncbi:adenylyltransferase/cytidyltransferase family protein [Natronobiforma cellulositropha]|uniref:adenylyltransferase/cytidyltransferase family protein n=1 Tax=Natronobiforma cellulositropha TaxID=1679076 RepID=UPI003CCC9CCD
MLAQGTFDILHPGHLHYLREAAAMGDQLHVVVATPECVTHKPKPILPLGQRRALVAALEVVDHAHSGHPSDISVPVRLIDPDVLVLGHDQHHDEAALADALESWDVDCEIRRASPREPDGDELLSSSAIRARIRERTAAGRVEPETLESS